MITVRKLSGAGVGDIKNPNSVAGSTFPVIIGGGVTLAVTLGIRTMMAPTAANATVRQNAEWIGAGAGVLAGLALWSLTSQPGGAAAIATSILVGGAMWGLEYAAQKTAASAVATAQTSGVLGAIVPEYSMRGTRGVGAIVMEPTAGRGYGSGAVGRLGSYGETVNLGSINPNAFGTSGASLAGGYR